MKKHIPNLITLLNLASGIIAILFAIQDQLEYAAYFVFLGIIFDFFDGFVARILGVQSELGVQLDSLADVVTSGVAPGIVMFQLLHNVDTDWLMTDYLHPSKDINFLPFVGIIVSLAAAYRLAKFNIDNRQHYGFIGLPTPAFSIFIVSLPLVSSYGNHEWAMHLVKNHYFLIVVVLLGSYLMNSNLALFSLKFSNYQFKENAVKYIFIVLTIILLAVLKVTAIPFLIILYILVSTANNLVAKKV